MSYFFPWYNEWFDQINGELVPNDLHPWNFSTKPIPPNYVRGPKGHHWRTVTVIWLRSGKNMLPGMVVRPKDGDYSNTALENLQLMSTCQSKELNALARALARNRKSYVSMDQKRRNPFRYLWAVYGRWSGQKFHAGYYQLNEAERLLEKLKAEVVKPPPSWLATAPNCRETGLSQSAESADIREFLTPESLTTS